MKWVCPAVVSEGPTDDRFLSGVLNRAVVDLCSRHFSDSVDVADVVPVRASGGPASIDHVIAALRRNTGSYNVVIFHHDGGANPPRVRREWIDPMRAAWAGSGMAEPMVFVVPVRETEAWALADGDALRRVFGVSWTNARLGIPDRPSEVSKIADPKKLLDAIRSQTGGRSRNHLARLGELVSLDCLGQVAAYAEWRETMTLVLENDLRLKR